MIYPWELMRNSRIVLYYTKIYLKKKYFRKRDTTKLCKILIYNIIHSVLVDE